jgi:hypothetical protein
MIVTFGFNDQSTGMNHSTYVGWPLALFSIRRLERTGTDPTAEEEHGWRYKRFTSGAFHVGFVKQERGTPHVVRSVIVPVMLTAPVLALLFLPSLLLVTARAGWMHVRTHRRRRRGQCVGCAYDLAGLSNGAAPVAPT